MEKEIYDYVLDRFSDFEFLGGFAFGWFGHMAARRWIFRKLRRII